MHYRLALDFKREQDAALQVRSAVVRHLEHLVANSKGDLQNGNRHNDVNTCILMAAYDEVYSPSNSTQRHFIRSRPITVHKRVTATTRSSTETNILGPDDVGQSGTRDVVEPEAAFSHVTRPAAHEHLWREGEVLSRAKNDGNDNVVSPARARRITLPTKQQRLVEEHVPRSRPQGWCRKKSVLGRSRPRGRVAQRRWREGRTKRS